MSLEDRLAAALRQCEWPFDPDLNSGVCVFCDGIEEAHGHTSDCSLVALLAEYDASQEPCECEHLHPMEHGPHRNITKHLRAHPHKRSHCQT